LSLLKSLYKLLPRFLRINFRKILKFFLYKFRYLKLKFFIYFRKDIKLILGAALTSQEGWLSTNEEWLNVADPKHWQRLFHNKNSVNNMVAEHVFEHLEIEEMRRSINLIYIYLRKNGTLRIAVPDGNHPDPKYRLNTGIRGIGADAADHKQFIKFEFIKNLLEEIGFKSTLREGYLKDGTLIRTKIDSELGFIKRSRSNNFLNKKDGWDFIDSNTSLIIDAIKL